MESFKADLIKQYVPKIARDKKAVEFYNLVQGIMTVAQCEKKFTELPRYAPHKMADEEEKVKKFQHRLALYIHEWIAPFQLEDSFEAFEKALVIEE